MSNNSEHRSSLPDMYDVGLMAASLALRCPLGDCYYPANNSDKTANRSGSPSPSTRQIEALVSERHIERKLKRAALATKRTSLIHCGSSPMFALVDLRRHYHQRYSNNNNSNNNSGAISPAETGGLSAVKRRLQPARKANSVVSFQLNRAIVRSQGSMEKDSDKDKDKELVNGASGIASVMIASTSSSSSGGQRSRRNSTVTAPSSLSAVPIAIANSVNGGGATAVMTSSVVVMGESDDQMACASTTIVNGDNSSGSGSRRSRSGASGRIGIFFGKVSEKARIKGFPIVKVITSTGNCY